MCIIPSPKTSLCISMIETPILYRVKNILMQIILKLCMSTDQSMLDKDKSKTYK